MQQESYILRISGICVESKDRTAELLNRRGIESIDPFDSCLLPAKIQMPEIQRAHSANSAITSSSTINFHIIPFIPSAPDGRNQGSKRFLQSHH